MPELRVTVTKKMNKLISEIVEETGLFSSKAELVRFATVAYLKELGWIKKPKTRTCLRPPGNTIGSS